METNANRPYAHRHSWISSIPLRTQIFRSMVVGDLGSRLEIFKMASNASDESSSEECGVHAAGPPKKKKKSYKCNFKKDWVKKWPSISAVSQDVYSFRCNMCATNFSCAHQGERDVTRHISRESHKRNVASLSSQKKVTETFLSSSNPLVHKVSHAEVKVAAMLVQNNIPLSLADELTPLLFQDIFPDSEIATKFSSRRSVPSGTSVSNEPKFIVFYSKLLAIFSLFCFNCKTENPDVEMKTSGTMVTVMQSCSKCRNEYVWKSQPLVLGKYPAGNILLSFAVLVAGASISKILLVFRHLGLCVYSLEHSSGIKSSLFFQQYFIIGNPIAQNSLKS